MDHAGDHRKVQTAVIGSKDAYRPVFIPFDKHDAQVFRRAHQGATFWCGTLLDGCGKQLSDKIYGDRVCHFAHYPPVRCRRVNVGEDSADHLFIAYALDRWLHGQNRPRQGSFTFNGLEHGTCTGLTVAYGKPRSRVAVQLADVSHADWERADVQATSTSANVDWIFGVGSTMAHRQVERDGYALRVRCVSEGMSRSVLLGFQVPDTAVRWVPLGECQVTLRGIWTPAMADMPNGRAADVDRLAREQRPPTPQIRASTPRRPPQQYITPLSTLGSLADSWGFPGKPAVDAWLYRRGLPRERVRVVLNQLPSKVREGMNFALIGEKLAGNAPARRGLGARIIRARGLHLLSKPPAWSEGSAMLATASRQTNEGLVSPAERHEVSKWLKELRTARRASQPTAVDRAVTRLRLLRHTVSESEATRIRQALAAHERLIGRG